MQTDPGFYELGGKITEVKFSHIFVPVACAAALAGCNSATAGPSDSYLWGKTAGNSAVSLVKNFGVEPSKACNGMIKAGGMWADNPVLNQTPPPKDFNRADAQKGCLDELHERLGY